MGLWVIVLLASLLAADVLHVLYGWGRDEASARAAASSVGGLLLGLGLSQLFIALGLALAWGWYGAPGIAVFNGGRRDPRTLLGGTLLCLGLGPAARALADAIARALHQQVTTSDLVVGAIGQATVSQLLLLTLALSVLPAFIEETLFRGAIQLGFERSPLWHKVVIPAVLFGVFHLDPSQGAGTALLGLGFGATRLLAGGLWAPILAHAANNALMVVGARFDSTPATAQGPGPWVILGGLLLCGLGFALLRASQRAEERG